MFGINCTLEMFQRIMRLILETCEGAISFIDDIIVNGRTKEELEVQTKANAERESNYRSDQTSEGYRNGCDCRQASGHANGSLVAPLRTRSTPMKRARTERSEYLSNSNIIMAMAIKCLSSRQHQHKVRPRGWLHQNEILQGETNIIHATRSP
uniref:Reverse transcriptase n=1 Tax=Vespula pensylvanica TaxID=30213 RepID=A0A834PFS4_VESPE|nr:hypothetical protein H0235_001241 [Vespula pensylvanica]